MDNEELNQILNKLDEITDKLSKQDERIKALEADSVASNKARYPRRRVPVKPRFVRKPKEKKLDGSMEEVGGKWFGHIGILALVFGTAFFLKYAFENNWIGEVGRVAIGIISGVALIGLGQYLRKKYLRYSDILVGGGIAILYLSIFAAFSFYSLITSSVAFALMALVTLLAGVMSVVDNSKTLAVIGILGGFLTPILVSTGQNRFYELFTYILVLDIGILGIALFKKWGRLNYLGFIGTVSMFFGWADKFYTVDQLGRTLTYMFAFFIVYLFTSIMHHLKRKEKTLPPDLTLIVANASIFAGSAYGMLTSWRLEGKYDDYLGFLALLLAVVYFFISHMAKKANRDDKNLSLFLLGISIVFLTVAIPIQLTRHWITLAWLIEALALYYLSFLPIELKKLKVFGAVVYIFGIMRLFGVDAYISRTKEYTLIFNYRFFITAVAIAVSYAVAYMFHRYLSSSVDSAGQGDKNILTAAQKNIKTTVIIFALMANILTIFIITAETSSYYGRQIYLLQQDTRREIEKIQQFYVPSDNWLTSRTVEINNSMYAMSRGLRHRMNTVTSVLWAIYAVLLMVLGIFKRKKAIRVGGMLFFFITALKVFLEMWELGELYRIISSITFGVIALVVSFVYTKYKDKLREFYEGED